MSCYLHPSRISIYLLNCKKINLSYNCSVHICERLICGIHTLLVFDLLTWFIFKQYWLQFCNSLYVDFVSAISVYFLALPSDEIPWVMQ